MRFDGTRVVVTGGGRGIGRGIVDAFLAEGAHVVATDRLDDAFATLRATHPESDRLSVHTADLADVDQVHGIVPAAVACWVASTCWSTTPASSRTDPSSTLARPTSTNALR